MHISIIEIDRINVAQVGWRLSRDRAAMTAMEDVAAVDAPVNELPSAVLSFENFMILEREIFASLHNHVMWARTSRVDDPLRYTVPTQFAGWIDRTLHRERRAAMAEQKRKGVSQDEWRMLLPLSAETSFVMRLSFRDIIKLVQYFRWLAEAHKDAVLGERFSDVALRLRHVAAMFPESGHKVVDRALATYKPIKLLHEKPLNTLPGISSSLYHATVSCTASIALRAQLVRHRALSVVDDFYQVLLLPDVLDVDIGMRINMEISASMTAWRSVVGKRACWIAQHDLWQPVTKHFAEYILPCEDGVCPYSKDAELRFTDADPGAPCPLYCNLNRIDKAPYKEAMLKENKGDFWLREIER